MLTTLDTAFSDLWRQLGLFGLNLGFLALAGLLLSLSLGFSLSLIGEENEISAGLIAECLLCGLSAYRDMKEIDVTGKAFEVFKEFLEGMEKT